MGQKKWSVDFTKHKKQKLPFYTNPCNPKHSSLFKLREFQLIQWLLFWELHQAHLDHLVGFTRVYRLFATPCWCSKESSLYESKKRQRLMPAMRVSCLQGEGGDPGNNGPDGYNGTKVLLLKGSWDVFAWEASNFLSLRGRLPMIPSAPKMLQPPFYLPSKMRMFWVIRFHPNLASETIFQSA